MKNGITASPRHARTGRLALVTNAIRRTPVAIAGVVAVAAATLGGVAATGTHGSTDSQLSTSAAAALTTHTDNTASRNVTRTTVAPAAAPKPKPHAPAKPKRTPFGIPASQQNPRTPAQAILAARKAVHGPHKYHNMCLNFVAVSYGWNHSGSAQALDHWRSMPKKYKHPGNIRPQPGALLFWSTSHPAGHVAIYLGHGLIASNDIHSSGAISIVPIREINQTWGAHYLGWTAPYFPNGF